MLLMILSPAPSPTPVPAPTPAANTNISTSKLTCTVAWSCSNFFQYALGFEVSTQIRESRKTQTVSQILISKALLEPVQHLVTNLLSNF